jgi:transposase
LTHTAHRALVVERRGAYAFRVRRAQMLLASARGQSARPMAQPVGCSVQTVRNVIRACNTGGLACLSHPSNRPKSAQPMLDEAKREQWRHLLPQSPRTVGQPTGRWTLALAAHVCHAPGLPGRLMRDDTMRRAIKRLGAHWKRAKQWSTSPEPPYARKKTRGIA